MPWALQASWRSSLLLIGLVCACHSPIAHGFERPGDANTAKELREYAAAAQAAQKSLLALCESASGEEQFNLYWAYNQSIGTWLQVEFLRILLEQARAATSLPDEQRIRATLRDQAQFTLWELDQNIAYPRRDSVALGRSEHLRLNETLQSLLLDVRSKVTRLTIDRK